MAKENGAGRRRGGIIGIVVVAAYAALRFGLLAWREHDDGMSVGGIVLSLVLVAVGVLVLVEIVFAVSNAHGNRREAALATAHPGAVLVRIRMKRDLTHEIENAAAMLGVLPDGRVPRSGFATAVADHHGIGIYRGGGTPQLVFGVPRQFVRCVGAGDTTPVGRYGVGRIDSLRVTIDNGRWTALDLPLYRSRFGFPGTLRGEELEARIEAVAAAAGVEHQRPA